MVLSAFLMWQSEVSNDGLSDLTWEKLPVMQGKTRTVGREKWTLAAGGRIMAVRSQVSLVLL